MKTMIYNNIHSLEDIHKQKLRLKKNLKAIERSISEKSDIVRLLLNTSERKSSSSGDKNNKLELIGYILTTGIKYIREQIKSNPQKKQYKSLIIYSAIGSVSAFMIYQYLKQTKAKSV